MGVPVRSFRTCLGVMRPRPRQVQTTKHRRTKSRVIPLLNAFQKWSDGKAWRTLPRPRLAVMRASMLGTTDRPRAKKESLGLRRTRHMMVTVLPGKPGTPLLPWEPRARIQAWMKA